MNTVFKSTICSAAAAFSMIGIAHNAAAATCKVDMQVGGVTKELERQLEDDGTFSYEIYTSEASTDVTADFYWRHVPGSGRTVMPSLDIGFSKQGFEKLRSGSYFILDGTGADGKPVQKVMQRILDLPQFNDFRIQNTDLLAAFPAGGSLAVRLMLPAKKGSEKPPKTLAQGALNMAVLKQEIEAFGPADILLNAKQANFQKECGGSEDSSATYPTVMEP